MFKYSQARALELKGISSEDDEAETFGGASGEGTEIYQELILRLVLLSLFRSS